MDMRDADPMDMAQLTNLNLGGAPKNPFILDRTYQGIATNMYPEATRPDFVPNIPVETTGRMNAMPLAKPSTKITQAGEKEIYDRYIEKTNQDTAPEALIPMVYRLRLEKIARSCKNLEAEVSEMEEYTKGLHRPNQNTNNAYRDFRRNLDLLEEESFKLIEKYTVAETHAPIQQLRNDMRKAVRED